MKKQNQHTKIKIFSDSIPTVTPKISHYHRFYCFHLLHHRFQQLLKNDNGIIYSSSKPSLIHLQYI